MQKTKLAVAFVPLLLALEARAESLPEVVAGTLTQNPEVQAKFHEFEAAQSEQSGARGGFLPRIDLEGRAGRARRSAPTFPSSSYSNNEASIELHQMLFDGFATRNEVRRLGFVKAAKYYDLMAKSDEIALEASRAYLDVKRYQDLVQLALDNTREHREIYDRLQSRTDAGVGARVDLELAGGRLALAQSNVVTESSNLHDVEARFLRVTGKAPARDLAAAPEKEMRSAIPPAGDVIKTAVRNNPLFLSAVSSLRAARAAGDEARSAYSPTLEFKASQSVEKNYFGAPGNEKDAFAGLQLNWNLYRGGRDQARIAQQKSLFYQAIDLREKTCRDVRQETAIAWNDTKRVNEQLKLLEEHTLAIQKTFEAFRDLFRVGKVTLLNLLDTQNELFQARRAQANARYDLSLAEARVLAGTHALLPALGVSKAAAEAPSEATDPDDPDDMGQVCDVAMPDVAPLPTSIAPVAPSASAPTPVPIPPVAPATTMGRAERAGTAAAPTIPDCEAVVRGWADSWSQRDYKRYVGYYSANFKPMLRRNLDDWSRFRNQRLGKSYISVELADLVVEPGANATCTARFVQTYHSPDYSDRVEKTLKLRNEQGAWRIMSEKSRPPKSASN